MTSRNPAIDWPRTLLDACRRLESADDTLQLTQLARQLDVGASELQRQFTRRLGISPKAYTQALQLHRLARASGSSRSALDAVHAAGYESAAAGYANATRHLGAPPGRLQQGLDIGCWLGLSELGWMLMAATDKGICWLAFGDAPDTLLADLRAVFPKAQLHDGEARLLDWFDRVREHILLPGASLDLPLDIRGTAFQARVWKALRRIPLGETRAYGEIAKQLQIPSAARAVAQACAANRVALLIPCHRVVAADGGLAGYRWGQDRKRALLQREAGLVDTPVPTELSREPRVPASE